MVARGGTEVLAGELPESVHAHTVVLIGTTGGMGFEAFLCGRRDEPNPMDRWSKRVVDPIAASLGVRAAYPNDRPYLPFQRWAQRAEDVHPSPLGLLIHPEHGLWHAFRAVLLIPGAVEGLPVHAGKASPCESCAEKPCLGACPTGAFSGTSYDVGACAAHLRADTTPRCLILGCRARDACPVGTSSRYGDAQIRFHMQAFARARGIETVDT
ncbi:MAG: ferredoxin [Hyphomicrobiaceae bacterium]